MSAGKDKRLSHKVRRSYIISTMSITLVLFMLGVVSYATLSALSAAHNIGTSIVVSVEMADGLDDAGRERIHQAIEATGIAAEVEFLSKDTKFEDEAFREQFEVDVDLLLGENPLRDSYEVTISEASSSRNKVDAFATAMRQTEGVEYVAVPPVEVVENMQRTVSFVSIVLVVFLAVLLTISVLLLNNTIRLAIYSKRYLINTMKLVGATKWYIMRPLLASALKQGIIAGIIAAVAVVGVVYGVDSFTPEGIAMLDYCEAGIIAGGLIVVGVVITVGFSAVAINKFVNMKSNKIYLY